VTRLTDAVKLFGDLDLQALAAIQKRHAELGGDAGVLGAAVTGLQLTSDGRSWYMDFEHGAIYHSWWQGTLALDGGNWLKYQETGRQNGPLGLPTSEESSILNNTAFVANYEKGAIYRSRATGVHAVHSGNWVMYRSLGAHDGPLGLPLDEERSALDDTYRFGRYQFGTIVWRKADGAMIVVSGLINDKWQAKGGITGFLGAPLGKVVSISGGAVQRFQNGSIFLKSGAGEAFEVHGVIRDIWTSTGREIGPYGWPISNGYNAGTEGKYPAGAFENGTIFFAAGYNSGDSQASYAAMSDVRQQKAGTCVILSTMAGVVRQAAGYYAGGLMTNRIRSLGRNLYDVYLPGANEWQRVYFDGVFSQNDPMPEVGLQGQAKYWTILMQRAVLQHYGVDWGVLNYKEWPNAQNWQDTKDVLHLLTGLRSYESGYGDLSTPEHLLGFLWENDILVTVTRKNGEPFGGNPFIPGSIGETTHQWVITSVFQRKGQWYVELYNPWGIDGGWSANYDGVGPDTNPNDGLVTVHWTHFKLWFADYGRATAS
jgi:hypothetical protein